MSNFDFQKALVAFNEMYGLPATGTPNIISSQRLKDFKSILLKEVNEIDEIIDQLSLIEQMEKLQEPDVEWANKKAMKLKVLVGLADLLGDIQVYCGSEMAKWGLPLQATLRIIMASNMSKLGADGKPIIDEEGKVLKGPNYWKPEPMLERMISKLNNPHVDADVLAEDYLGRTNTVTKVRD